MRMMLATIALFTLAGCATVPVHSQDGIARAKLGQRVYVDGPYVTPLAVLEDSRCPMNARCVWAGRTRLTVKTELGSRSETREIASDKPIQVADGTLALVEVQPDKLTGKETKRRKYRFGFTFRGGL
jgi:hypothetical protein